MNSHSLTTLFVGDTASKLYLVPISGQTAEGASVKELMWDKEVPRHSMLFSCNKCEKAFKRNDHLTRHKNNHSTAISFSCDKCKRGFRRKDLLVRHQRTHTQEKTYNCMKCKKSFSRKDHVQRHQQIHTKLKHFSCPDCKRRFRRKYHLTKHQRTHGNDMSFIPKVDIHRIKASGANAIAQRRFSCIDCDKSFAVHITFLRHQAVHTKRYMEIISQAVHKEDTNSGTRGHTRDMRQRPFFCDQCDKTFSVRKGLLVHQRVHAHGYTCSECGKSFRLKCHLVKHQKIHSGHRQCKNTSQKDRSCTAVVQEECNKENKGEAESSQRESNRENGHTVLNCFNFNTKAEKNTPKHPKKGELEAPTVCSKKVILKAATFVFRSSLNDTTQTIAVPTERTQETALMQKTAPLFPSVPSLFLPLHAAKV